MKRKIVYIINPISGTASKAGLTQLIEAKSKVAQVDYEIIPSTINGNYKHLVAMVEDGVTDIVACGGDGTISSLAAAMVGQQVNIGIVPMGSGNGLARTAGISMAPGKALDVVIRGKSMWVDGFTINGQFSCMLSGLGFDAQVAHRFAQRTRRGLISYTQDAITQFFRAHFYPFEIVLPEFRFFSDAFFISIANSNQFGNNFTIAPQASLNDGLLDIVIVQKMSKMRLPFAIMRQVRGNNHLQQLVSDIGKKNVLYFQTPSLQIGNHRHAPLHIDGDPKDTADFFDIRIVPNAFRLLMP